jgi:hypothetical protein
MVCPKALSLSLIYNNTLLQDFTGGILSLFVQTLPDYITRTDPKTAAFNYSSTLTLRMIGRQ